MLKILSKLTTGVLAAALMLTLACAVSCGDSAETKISSADDHLTYGDTLGQDADEMMELIENS